MSDHFSDRWLGRSCCRKVYRYRGIDDWLRPILVDDELYFATPAQCNDPFDCRFEASIEEPLVGLEKVLREARVATGLHLMIDPEAPVFGAAADLLGDECSASQFAAMSESQLRELAAEIYTRCDLGGSERLKRVKEWVERARERIGVCCFANRGDDLLMFAHYARQHEGCCLEFETRQIAGTGRRSIFENESLHLCDVHYGEALPVVPVYEIGATLTSVLEITLTKHTRWAYEGEVRAVRLAGPGPVRYRREALTGVIFGHRASAADVDRVLAWLGDRPEVALSRAVPSSDHRLECVPLG